MKLYLCRHGATALNKIHHLGGDESLIEEGEEQAEQVAQILKGKPFNKIFCSTMKRAQETAGIIQKNHPATPVVEVSELVEMDFGDVTGVLYPELEEQHPQLFEERRKDKWNVRYPGGESYADVVKRIAPFLSILGEETICIVGHQGVNRAMLKYLLNLAEEVAANIPITHTTIFEIDTEAREAWYLEEGGRKSFP